MLYKVTINYKVGNFSIFYFEEFSSVDAFLNNIDVRLYESLSIEAL